MSNVTDPTSIAHLSDVHLLAAGEGTSSRIDLGTRFVSLGRALDVRGRATKLARALWAAATSRAHHVVISGDLTEMGTTAQFEAFAESLFDSGIDPERIILAPGNHDAYTAPGAWTRALEGPLAPFRRGAAAEDGKVVERDGVVFFPVDVACHQPVTRSAGELREATLAALARRFDDSAWRGLARVVVLHHPPFARSFRAWHWIDGLRGWQGLAALLQAHPDVAVLHGHLHHATDRRASASGDDRIFGVSAVVDDPDAEARIRCYTTAGGAAQPAGGAVVTGAVAGSLAA